MPASEPPLSVVDKYEELREYLPDLENIGAKHEDLDLLNEVLGDSEYQALGEVFDLLSMQLPEAEDGSVSTLAQDVVEAINNDYRPPKHAREMRDILTDPHFKAFLEAYEDVVTKAYISDNDDSMEDRAPKMGRNERKETEFKREEEEDGRLRREEEERKADQKEEKRKQAEIRDELERKLNISRDERDDDKDDKRDRGRDSDRDRSRDSDRERGRDGRPNSSYYPPAPVFDQYRENQRFVILKKSGNEPLGITVRQDDNDNLFIAKIRQNSLADKQSRLEIGDVVKEVNGEAVFVPEDLMVVLKDVEEWIIIKIVPQSSSKYSSDMTFMRACINYNSMTDRLIPYKKVGLSYNIGDMLAVLDDTDENWWQARMADDPNAPVGLIPSRSLQEKRQVFVKPETAKAKSSLLCGMGKKKKKVGYDSTNAGEYEDGHVRIYEDVELSETCRLSVVLIGVDKECKRTLKERLIRDYPLKYATVVPETSRPMKGKDKQGKGFLFEDPEDMRHDMKRDVYIQEGEYNGHLYGLRLSAIKGVANSGKMCVLDVAPQYLKTLMCQEFRPLVVFIAAPRWESVKARNKYRKGRRINNNRDDSYDEQDDDILEEKCRELEKESSEIKERYKRNFDEVIVNDDLENTYQNLVGFLEDVTSRGQKWVPKKWGKTI